MDISYLQTFLHSYLYETIGLIVVLFASIIFFLQRNKEVFPKKDIKKIQEIIPEDVPKADKSPYQEFYKENIHQEKEKELEDISEPKEKEQNIKISEEIPVKKRDVPPHEKITKQNFKEFAGSRLLVAEDNFINQKVITGLLAGTGIEVVLANDGEEALNILQDDTNFDMIVMDVHMPNMDGFEATRAIKSNPELQHLIVVALSGDTAVDDIKKTIEAGMDDHLEKPLKMDSFYDVLYSYTKNNKNKDQSSDFIEVIYTKELNGDKGLEICGGDENFYREILQEFINTYEDSTDELNNLLRADKLVEADKLLLDLIGVTANIGADQLYHISQDIKEALRDTDEKSYLTLLQQYKEHMRILIKDINEYL